jgi:hypothetical protein
LGILSLGPRHFHRSLAPSPVPSSTILLSTAAYTPPPQPISTPQTAPAAIIQQRQQPVTPSTAPCPISTWNEDRWNALHRPMTRTEFIRIHGHRAYKRHKGRWTGAQRGELR